MLSEFELSTKKQIVKELQEQIKQEEEDIALMNSPAMQRALEDVRCGRVTEYKSVQEMFEKLGIK